MKSELFSLRKILYTTEKDSFKTFLIFYFAPVMFATFIGVMLLSLALFYFGIIPMDHFMLLLLGSPLMGVMAVFFAIYMQQVSRQEDIEKNLTTFVTFLGTLATAKTTYSEFFQRVAETEEYGEISREMKKVYDLSVHWKLGYAQACKVLADVTTSKIFSRFLDRFSRAVEYGEDLSSYLLAEQDIMMMDIQIQYQQSVHTISLITELFTSFVFSFSFLIIFAIILPMFMGGSPETYLILMGLGLFLFDFFFLLFTKKTLPSDKLTHDLKQKSTDRNNLFMSLPIAIAPSLFLFIILVIIDAFTLTMTIAISATPLLIIGYYANIEESKIKMREELFTQFITTLGEYASRHKGSLKPVVRRLATYDYKLLSQLVRELYIRLATTGDVFRSWAFFAVESGSNIITKFTNIFIGSIYSGSDPKTVSTVISSNINKLLEFRKLREETASGSRGELYGVFFGVSLTMFITVGVAEFVFGFFSGAATTLETVQTISFLSIGSMDVGLIYLLIVGIVVFHAAFSALLIKFLDGGIIYGATTHFVIMIWIMAISDWAVGGFFQQFFGSMGGIAV